MSSQSDRDQRDDLMNSKTKQAYYGFKRIKVLVRTEYDGFNPSYGTLN